MQNLALTVKAQATATDSIKVDENSGIEENVDSVTQISQAATQNELEERIKELEKKVNEAETLDSVKPDRLQKKLNAWVDQIEKQVKDMEKKLTKKIHTIETMTNSNLCAEQ